MRSIVRALTVLLLWGAAPIAAVAQQPAPPPMLLDAVRTYQSAMALFEGQKYPEAVKGFEAAIPKARAAAKALPAENDAQTVYAVSLFFGGTAALQVDDLDHLVPWWEEALPLWQARYKAGLDKQDDSVLQMLQILAAIKTDQEDFKAARAYYEQALPAWRRNAAADDELGHKELLLRALVGIADGGGDPALYKEAVAVGTRAEKQGGMNDWAKGDLAKARAKAKG